MAWWTRALRATLLTALLATLLAACGGGGSGGSDPNPAAPGLDDATPYSTDPAASLATADERAAVTSHTVTVAGAPVAYTATIGHLTALAPLGGAAEATMFYTAYTVAAKAGPNRPIVYFYNGGPGSATVWLHLGSFAPRRIVTLDPSLAIPTPFQLVDNAESLIDVADLVFVDAVGSGYSEAIAPFTNQSFWSVDKDAAVMRDFIARYAAVNQRGASPTFIFGESYGTTRSAVLAHLMVAAGMPLDGVVLQSSILDYNSNCDMFTPDTVSCEGSLPSYAMIGAWFSLTNPVPTDVDGYAQQLRVFSATTYGPAVTAWLQGQAANATLLDQLAALTGAARPLWASNLDLDAATFRSHLVPGQLLGRYDARVAANNGTALANSGDPSSALINGPFSAAARSLFSGELQYTASASYVLLSNAIDSWDFSHDGRALPDTIPDLAAALAQRPALRVLSLAGYHDLATPFRQTELDVTRLGTAAKLTTRVYAGGHMTYLDDGSRPRIKADVAAFVTTAALAAAAASPTPAGIGSAEQQAAGAARAADSAAAGAALPRLPPSSLSRSLPGSPAASPSTTSPASLAASFAARQALAQGGDPYLPPSKRDAARTPSPAGEALRALVQRKIAERNADPYR